MIFLKVLILLIMGYELLGCAGLKVVNPQDTNENKDTKMLDFSGGKVQVVGTFTCRLKSSGKSFSAIEKTEERARVEVLARCRDHTVISFCKDSEIKCEAN